MTELKTLKDFIGDKRTKWYKEKATTWEFMIDAKRLRQEAIKWIKYFQNKEHPKHLIKDNKEAQAFSEGIQLGTIDFIKKFFNITEKELK